MIARCPNCGTQYVLNESLWTGHAQVQGRCKKCENTFMIHVPVASKPSPPNHPEEATRLASQSDYLRLPADKVVALSVTEGPQKGEVFRLNKARVLVGRSGADIVLNDPEVSRKHCAIEVHGNTGRLVDLGTTNGTLVGGQRVESFELEHLAEFRVGTTTLLFTVTDKG